MKNHNPDPKTNHAHHIWPLGEGGPERDQRNIVAMCPTSHDAAHVLWRRYKKHDGPPPGSEIRYFNRYVREIVQQGWDWYKAGEVQA